MNADQKSFKEFSDPRSFAFICGQNLSGSAAVEEGFELARA